MDIDTNLPRLSGRIDHPQLSSIDDRVLTAIQSRRLGDRSAGFHLSLIAGAAAALIGVASTRAA